MECRTPGYLPRCNICDNELELKKKEKTQFRIIREKNNNKIDQKRIYLQQEFTSLLEQYGNDEIVDEKLLIGGLVVFLEKQYSEYQNDELTGWIRI